MMLGASIIYPFRRNITEIFADNPNILNETDLFLQVLMPSLPFFGLFMAAISAGRGSGRTLFPTVVGMPRFWGIRIALGYLLAFILDMSSLGIWLVTSISNFLGGIIAILWIKYRNCSKAIIKGNSA